MSIPTAQEEKDPKWIKTRVQHVYRRRDSGRYYVRGFRQGKVRRGARAQAADVLKEIILSNPANAIGKVNPRQKPMRVPTPEQFTVLVQEIRNAGGAVSHCSADLVEFLGYTGCRIDESRWVRWEHVDRQRNVIEIWGDPETATKNYEVRRVPIIPPLAKLLNDLKQTPLPAEPVASPCLTSYMG